MAEHPLQRFILWAYDQALASPQFAGLKVLKNVDQLAEEYLAKPGTLEVRVGRFVRAESSAVAVSGFVTNLGGIVTLPVGLPADIAHVLFRQLRMVATIAKMYGHDPNDQSVKAFAFACLLGNAAREAIAASGARVAGRVTTTFVLERVSAESIARLNQIVGMQLVARTGSRGVINLVSLVPVASGLVVAGVNAASNQLVATAARRTFRAVA